MSELNKNTNMNEIDASEMLEEFRREHKAEPRGEDVIAQELRRFQKEAQEWHHRRGWDAFWLGALSCVTALSCGVALVTGAWMPIVGTIGAGNLILMGAWFQKAKAGWDA